MAEISIIVPVFNVEKYLEDCIKSILNQTFKDYELILVDDGSTDRSSDICDKYKDKDSRIKVIHKTNGGPSSARNAGLDIACGNYIGFIDSDDSIHPRMYEILYDLIKKHKAEISFCDYKYVYSTFNEDYEDIKLMEVNEMDNIQAINKLYDKDIGVRLIVPWNKLYAREIFNGIRYEEGRVHEDDLIAHRLLYKCKNIVYGKSELYYYLQRKGSIMSKITDKRKVDTLLVLSDRMKFFNNVGLKNMCGKTAIIYIQTFFDTYNQIRELNSSEKAFLKLLKRDFISNMYILLRLKKEGVKTKILWILFCINPNIYNAYYE